MTLTWVEGGGEWRGWGWMGEDGWGCGDGTFRVMEVIHGWPSLLVNLELH